MKTGHTFSKIATVALCAFTFSATAQNNLGQEEGQQINTITTAVPFLLIAPDSRAGGMGDVGVAVSPDANSMHWNASKLAFAENEFEVSLSYSPWLRSLVPDINLAYLSAYKKLDKESAIGMSLRYFSLGDITFTDQAGNVTGNFKPSEYAVDFGYARKLSDKLSGALSVRYIFSNLTGNAFVEGAQSKPGRSVAADLSVYYVNDDMKVGEKDATFAFGTNVSNIGSKMSYTESSDQDFIPINLRLGPSLKIDIDEYQSFTMTFDVNKLLVPTPPIYQIDSAGQPMIEDGEFVIASGRDPNVGVAPGMFGSFSDAPGIIEVDEDGNAITDEQGNVSIEKGSKFKEELREFNLAGGLEYWYANQFAIRAGYFHEHATKGNRKFFTLGAGLRYSIFALDFAYLIPTEQRNPLANTLRFTLRFNFETLKKKDEEPEG